MLQMVMQRTFKKVLKVKKLWGRHENVDFLTFDLHITL